jgi:hypothetical protein
LLGSQEDTTLLRYAHFGDLFLIFILAITITIPRSNVRPC